MKFWIITLFALIGLARSACAEDHVNGIYDGRSIPGWSYYATESTSQSFWVTSDGWSFTAHALCSVAQDPGIATLQAWRPHVPPSAEAFAAAVAASAPGRMLRPGSELQPLDISGHPAFRFQVQFSDADGEKMLMGWTIAGVEATLVITCNTDAAYAADAAPRFEAFANAFEILTNAPR